MTWYKKNKHQREVCSMVKSTYKRSVPSASSSPSASISAKVFRILTILCVLKGYGMHVLTRAYKKFPKLKYL